MRSASRALQLVGPLQRLVGRAAGDQPFVDDRQRGQRAGDELGQVAVVAERATREPGEGLVVDVVERVDRPQRQRRLGAAQRRAIGAQPRRAGERQPVEHAGQRIGQHVDRDRDRDAGEQQHRQRRPARRSPPCRSMPARRTAPPPHRSRRTSAACRRAAPGPRRTHPTSRPRHRAAATSNPVDAKASQLGTSPSGITRIALPSAKNSVATTT